MMLLSHRLRSLRLSLRLRQKEMASRLDVSLSSYRMWEYGMVIPRPLALAELNRRIEQVEQQDLRKARM